MDIIEKAKDLVGLGKELPEGMSEFSNEVVYFTVPTRPTVRQQLAYLGGAAILPGAEMFIRLWEGAVALIDDWKCKTIPDINDFDLDNTDDLAATNIILWVGLRVREHMNKLDEVPKN